MKNSRIPSDANVWVFHDNRFSRIYHRSDASANVTLPPPHVDAVGDHCEDGDIVIDLGERHNPRRISRNRDEEVELEEAQGEVDLRNAIGGIDEEQIFQALSEIFRVEGNRIQLGLTQAGLALQLNDSSSFAMAGESLMEVLTGAAPGPVGGTNYIYQLNQAVDDTSKVVMACQCSSSAKWDTSGATGNFGTASITVDQTLQALASVLASVADVFSILRLYHQEKMAHPQHAVDLHKLRRGRYADLGSNLMKSYTTLGSSVGAISAFASSAGTSILTSSTAASLPGVGAVTGLATMIRSSWHSEKSRKRAKRLKSIQQTAQTGHIDPRTQGLLEFSIGKAMRKHRFKALEATAAAGSMTSSTALAVGAALATANAWNPVGWGIGAVCIIAGGGLLTYKIVRSKKSSKRARRRGFDSADFPMTLVKAYVSFRRKSHDSLDTLTLASVLETYGVNPSWLHRNSPEEFHRAQDAVQAAIARIERHLK